MIRADRSGVNAIPNDWGSAQLKEIASILPGGRLKLTKTADYREAGVPAYSAAGQDGFVEQREFTGPGVVLSSIGARCGKAFYAEGDWTTLANTYVIKSDEKVLINRFLWYLVNDENFWHRSGTAQPFISPADIRNAWIPVPPSLEQSRIVHRLDAVSTQIKGHLRLVESLQRLGLGCFERLRDGYFFGSEPKYRRLDSLADLKMGETIIARDLTGDGIPVYSAETRAEPWGFTSRSRRRYSPGTIILSARGSIGYPRLPNDPVYVSTQTTIAVKPDETLLPQFLHIWLRSLDYKVLSSVQAVPMLTVSTMNAVKIPCPTFKEQREIIKVFSLLDKAVETQRQLSSKLEVLLTGLKQQLLYGSDRISQ